MSRSLAWFAALASVLLLAGLSSGVSALAADTPKPTDAAAMFATLDVNKDGQLSGEELPEDKRRLFERLVRVADKNGDGKLSSEEFAAGLTRQPDAPAKAAAPAGGPEGRPAPEKMFKRLDGNSDGKVTLDEVPEPRREMFQMLVARGDKDGDGALSQQEFVAAFPGSAERPQGKPNKPKRPDDAKRPEGAGRAAELFRRLDSNADGKVTLDEVPEERKGMIQRLLSRGDKDNDQALTLAELASAFGGGNPPEAGKREALADSAPPLGLPGGPPPGLFVVIDANHDGKLDADEIAAAAEAIRKLDKNGDGNVTLDEILPPASGKEAKP